MKQIIDWFWKFVELVALWCLRLLFKILGKELTDEMEQGFLQFVRFGVVGVSNTVVAYGVYVVALLAIRSGGFWLTYDYLIANITSFILSVAWSFFWNNKYVFTVEEGESRSIFKALIKTYVSYSFTSLFLNSIFMVLWVQILGISEFLAPFINLFINVPINFIINKFWAFKKEGKERR